MKDSVLLKQNVLTSLCLLVASVVIFEALAQGRRTSVDLLIRADQWSSGGSWKHSVSYRVFDTLAAPQPTGVTRSPSYINRAGLSYSIAEARKGDINDDFQIDHKDVFLFGRSWQTVGGDPNYSLSADLITDPNDRWVNEEDLFELMRIIRRN